MGTNLCCIYKKNDLNEDEDIDMLYDIDLRIDLLYGVPKKNVYYKPSSRTYCKSNNIQNWII